MKNLTLIVCLLTLGCVHLPTCQEDEAFYKADSTQIILLNVDLSGSRSKFNGIKPITKEAIEYSTTSRFFFYLNDSLQIGDTLNKERGSMNYTVQKKGRNITFTPVCDSAVRIITSSK